MQTLTIDPGGGGGGGPLAGGLPLVGFLSGQDMNQQRRSFSLSNDQRFFH